MTQAEDTPELTVLSVGLSQLLFILMLFALNTSNFVTFFYSDF